MRNLYQRFAGSSLERLSALSDGIFAVAMTLLVLDLHVPEIPDAHGAGPLWSDGPRCGPMRSGGESAWSVQLLCHVRPLDCSVADLRRDARGTGGVPRALDGGRRRCW
ncbi:TMEM175 family protein [Streptomyces sp. NPDC023838]|uniref:TMEM175 family protein n=1 Tax=Streptomyces sp. NPDC023838 TaxID=3154325 RepID=UPI0033EE9028